MFHYCLRFSLSPADMVEIKVVETQMVSRARRGTHSVWSEHTDKQSGNSPHMPQNSPRGQAP